MGKGLGKKMLSGVIWSSIGRFSTLIIQFIVTLIIARKLGPSAFGVVGLLTVFLAIGKIMVDSGFGAALIQSRTNNIVDFSSVFFFNLFLGIVLYFILFFVSPLLDNFYNIHNLHVYANILFLIIPISSLGLIQDVLLKKDLEFKKISVINIVSSLLSGIVGIIFAYSGFGVYSLIAQMLLNSITSTLMFILVKRWVPKMVFSLRSLKPLFLFGVNLTLSNLIIAIFNNIYTIIIGKVYSSEQVGYYNQAKQYESLSSNTITEIVMNVSFPILVEFKNDKEKLKINYAKIIETVVFIVSPLMMLLYVVSEDLFLFLLSDKWVSAAPYFQILCLYGVTFPLHQINGNVMKVTGNSRMYLFVEIVRRVLLVVSIVLTINISIEAMLYGQILSMLILILISMYVSGRLINYPVWSQLKAVSIYYVVGFFSVVVSFLVYKYLLYNAAIFIRLILVSMVCFLSYYFSCSFLKVRALLYVQELIFKNRNLK